MLNRFKLQELTMQRLASATLRRIQDIPHRVAWNTSISKENRTRLGKYSNCHTGQRCFILANGPSLTQIEFPRLRNEFTIGMNRIYLIFDQLQFVPSYYVCINELVLEQFVNDINNLPMPKFLNWNRRQLFDQKNQSTLFIRLAYGVKDFFGQDPKNDLSGGGTVTYTALQLAYYMGFQQVILVGLDHSYTESGIPNKIEVRKYTEDTSHFHPGYFPQGIKWQLPDLKRSEIAYALAREQYEQNGRSILDATIGGKCTVFEKVDFQTLF